LAFSRYSSPSQHHLYSEGASEKRLSEEAELASETELSLDCFVGNHPIRQRATPPAYRSRNSTKMMPIWKA